MKAKSRVLKREVNLASAELQLGMPALSSNGRITFRYLLQPFGHFQFFSPAVTYLTGHTPAEYYKFPNLWLQDLHPGDREKQSEILHGRVTQKSVNIRVKSANGSYVPIQQSIALGLDEEGNPQVIDAECLVSDEMQLRQMSGDLSHPGLVSFIDEGPIPTIISAVESGKILFANKQFVRLFKYSLDQLLDATITELPIWDTVEDRDYFSWIKNEKGELAPKEMRFKDADGTPLVGMLLVQVIPFEGQPCYMTRFLDLTSQAQARSALEKETHSLSRLIEYSPLPINVIDALGRVVLWNRRSEEVFGWKAEEVKGQTIPFLVDYGEQAFQKFYSDIKKERSWSGTEVKLRKKDGSQVQSCMYNSPVLNEDGEMIGILNILTEKTDEGQARLMQRALYDISEATSETQNLDELYKSIHAALGHLMPVNNFFIALVDYEHGLIQYPYYVDEVDPPPEPVKGERGLTELVIRSGESILADPIRFAELVASGEVAEVGAPSIDWLGVPLKIKDRTIGAIAVQSYTEGVRFTEEHRGLLEFVSDQIAMAIERVRNEETIRLSEKRYRAIIEDQTDLICRYALNGRLSFVNQAFCDFFGKSRQSMLESTIFELLPEGQVKGWFREGKAHGRKHSSGSAVTCTTRPDGSLRWVQWKNRVILDDTGELVEIQSVGRDITEQQMRQSEMELIGRITNATRFARATSDMLNEIIDQIQAVIQVDGLAFAMYEPHQSAMVLDYGRGCWKDFNHELIPLHQAAVSEIFKTREIYINNNLVPDPKRGDYRILCGLTAVAGIPLIADDTPIGVLWLGKKTPITSEEIRLIRSIVEITANGIHRVKLFEKTQERLRRLTTLKTIDLAITSTVDLKVILDILIDQIINQLEVDAASIWLYDPITQLLEYRAGRGFQNANFQNYRLRLGESHAGGVALERKREIILDLSAVIDSMTDFYRNRGEHFSSFIAVPLIAKGQVKGVLEIFTNRTLVADAEWLEFLDSLGGQAAIALDNATMFERLQRSNVELGMAYDATIEGWARALEMRDQETIGHTRRVADLTIGLIKLLNYTDLDIEQIRRGVMLHDIGKMGIPDRILLKKSKLTQAEWKIMRMHPTYAYDMLHSVPNLRMLVDIPYCHHERWDGAGYPRGLKGEEIPLIARIFTVVDVWDAITSDRPYRPAWTEKQAIEFMQSESGKQFDPDVVKTFIDNLDSLVRPVTGFPRN